MADLLVSDAFVSCSGLYFALESVRPFLSDPVLGALNPAFGLFGPAPLNLTNNQYAILRSIWLWSGKQAGFGAGGDLGNMDECNAQPGLVWCLLTLSPTQPAAQAFPSSLGICTSRLCSPEFLLQRYSPLASALASRASLQCGEHVRAATLCTAGYAFLIMGGCVLLLLAGSTWQAKVQHEWVVGVVGPAPRFTPRAALLSCFSLQASWASLLQTRRGGRMEVDFLDGLRVLSTVSIVTLHTCTALTWEVAVAAPNNPDWARHITSSFLYKTFVTAASRCAVDSFFWLSGFLLVLRCSGKICLRRLPALLWRRWLRLAPLYYVVTGVWVLLLPSLGSGPLWGQDGQFEKCAQHWWRNFFFIATFFDFHSLCPGEYWFVEAVWHATLIGLLLMFLADRRPRLGCGLMGVCAGLPLSLRCLGFSSRSRWKWLFPGGWNLVVWGRSDPFFLGMLFAYLVLRKSSLRLPVWLNARAGLFGQAVLTIFLMILLSTLPTELSSISHAYYLFLMPVLWASGLSGLCWCWLFGPPTSVGAHWLLARPGFEPLGKLCFGIYLWHPVLVRLVFDSLHDRVAISAPFLFLSSAGILLASTMFAFISWICVESPFIAMSSLSSQHIGAKTKQELVHFLDEVSNSTAETRPQLDVINCD
eukprot:gb/GEZN01002819.1/.p1 GENE.gb/GEZN01002819.1/~~gb/GEZN01002819.1/.p1  ORF type:complete len:646 (+),score=63.51 gb/GEZN01002819.1/:39-1976(+)